MIPALIFLFLCMVIVFCHPSPFRLLAGPISCGKRTTEARGALKTYLHDSSGTLIESLQAKGILIDLNSEIIIDSLTSRG